MCFLGDLLANTSCYSWCLSFVGDTYPLQYQFLPMWVVILVSILIEREIMFILLNNT